MIIICDIDNCINNLTEQVFKVYNKRTGQSITMDDLKEYDLYACFDKKEADAIKELFLEKDIWDALKPIVGAKQALQRLIDDGHKILFATATDPINFPWKIAWVQTYFPFVNSANIIRIMDKSLLRGDIIIDDDMTQLTKSFCERICFDYPWNRNDRKDYVYDIYRAKSWTDIVNIINQLERKSKKYE